MTHRNIVNIDKHEYLNPFNLGADGDDIRAFSSGEEGFVSSALMMLLTTANDLSDGDFLSDSSVVGSWAGDRIVITSEEMEPNKFMGDLDVRDIDAVKALGTFDMVNLHIFADQMFAEISVPVITQLIKDDCVRRKMVRLASKYHSEFTVALEQAVYKDLYVVK